MADVLVVDDSKLERQKMKKILEEEGHSVTKASNGKEAVEKYKKNRYDLVLLDIVMDKIDGLEALKQMKDIDEDVHIVIISGVGNDETVSEALRIGAERYVFKPVLRSKIVPALNQVLG